MNRGLFAITGRWFGWGKGHDFKTVIRYKANLTDTKDDLFIDLNDSELDAGGNLLLSCLFEYRRK